MKGKFLKHLSISLVLTLSIAALSGCQSTPAENVQSTQGTQSTEAQVSTTVAEEQVSDNIGSFKTTDMAGGEVTESVFADHKLTMVNVFSVG